jgi:hypothetical protein
MSCNKERVFRLIHALAATVASKAPHALRAARARRAMVNLDAGVNALAAQTQARVCCRQPLARASTVETDPQGSAPCPPPPGGADTELAVAEGPQAGVQRRQLPGRRPGTCAGSPAGGGPVSGSSPRQKRESRGGRHAPRAASPSPRAALASPVFRVTPPPVSPLLPRGCFPAALTPLGGVPPSSQVEEDNREILRLLRDTGTAEKLEGMKRLIAQSECGPRSRGALETWHLGHCHLPLTRRTPHRSVRRP